MHYIKKIGFVVTLVSVLMLEACSTKKNTPAARSYHETTIKYNIYFNASISYLEGLELIEKGNVDDYSRVLPMFVISNKENQTKATTQMDRVIEKCRKAIKKHSITKKPKRDKGKWSDPKYQAFYNQKEFVQGVKKSWVTLGKAEYYKGDFIGAVGTFSYIVKNYPNDLDVVCESRIWMARAYSEMGWMYEAEEVLGKIKEDNLHRKLTGDYAATRADLLMKEGQYAEAYAHLIVAAKNEKRKAQRTRYHYILGQIAYAAGDKEVAAGWFKMVKKAAPPYILEFNTRLNMYAAQANDKKATVKGLEKMAKHPNNLEYLDQVYHTMGDVYLANGDTAEAIKAYQKGAVESVRNGKDKAALLIKTGNLFLAMKNYVEAFPCFQQASTLIDNTHPDYKRIEKLGLVLGDVAVNYEMVVLQDSLQELATLSEEEQMDVIEGVIEQVIADEEEAARLAQEAEDKANTLNRRTANSMAPPAALGFGASQDWYFYNDKIKQSGMAQFTQKWGRRKLEDNWRRSNKLSTGFGGDEGDVASGGEDIMGGEKLVADSALSDNKNPAYYLAQIPSSADDIAASNEEIKKALYKLGEVYSVGLEDYPAALDVYRDFLDRFDGDSLSIEVLYACYRLNSQMDKEDSKDYYKSEIIRLYPESTYALMLSQPDYVARMQAMYAEQDSIYAATYASYGRSEFANVRSMYEYMKEKYPLSELMPKFALLNALSVGRSVDSGDMFAALTEVAYLYPNSDVAPMCKDVLALMNQGKKAQKGGVTDNLAAKRQQAMDSIKNAKLSVGEVLEFVVDASANYEVYIVPKDARDTVMNMLLYNIALFNFTKFMIKEYDISVESIDGNMAVKLSGFVNEGEAKWYETMLLAEPMLQGLITLDVCDRVLISTDNVNAIRKGLTLDEYKAFMITKQ